MDKQYVSRKEEGRGSSSIEDNVDTSIWKHKKEQRKANYIDKK